MTLIINSNRLFVFFFFFVVSGVTFGTGFGTDIFARLQLGTAEGTEEHRMIDEARLFFFQVDEADRHVNNGIGPDRDQRFEIAAFERFFQLRAATAEIRFGFRCHGLSLRYASAGWPKSLCCFGQFFGFCHRFFDGADHVKRGLWQVIVIAVA